MAHQALVARRQRLAHRARRDSAAADLHGMAQKPRSRAHGAVCHFKRVEPAPPFPAALQVASPHTPRPSAWSCGKAPRACLLPLPISTRAAQAGGARGDSGSPRAWAAGTVISSETPESAREPRGAKTAAQSGARCICACARRAGGLRGAAVAASAPARWRARMPFAPCARLTAGGPGGTAPESLPAPQTETTGRGRLRARGL